jgi:hypothetical protein
MIKDVVVHEFVTGFWESPPGTFVFIVGNLDTIQTARILATSRLIPKQCVQCTCTTMRISRL